MKILKQATKIESLQLTCKHCHSVLELTKDDVKFSESRGGDSEKYFTCPVCGEHNFNSELQKLFQYYINN